MIILFVQDRASLSLDKSTDALIVAVGKVATATVVLVQSSGAFLSPWRTEVARLANPP